MLRWYVRERKYVDAETNLAIEFFPTDVILPSTIGILFAWARTRIPVIYKRTHAKLSYGDGA